MKCQGSARKRGAVLKDLRAEDRFSSSLASLATMLVARRAAPESRNGNERLERQPDGESTA